MPTEPPSVRHILVQCKDVAEPTLRIHFPTITVSSPATSVTKDASKPAPSLSIPSKIVNPSAKYIAIALDPDAPFPSMPLLGPVLHWIQTDLTTDDDADDDGWIKLTSSAKAVVYWGPPGPPPISAPHRYVFLVWEQPKDLTNEQARTSLGLPEEVGLRSRVRWNQEDCEKILGLGQVLGGNYFVAG